MCPFRLLFICSLLLFGVLAHAQNATCYTKTRQKGMDAYNAKKYTDAINFWEAAKGCSYVPADNDLNSWIKKANDKLNPPESSTPNKRPVTNNAADEAAWKLTQRINSKAAYEAYLADYPKGKYAATARQKIKNLTPITTAVPFSGVRGLEPIMVEVKGGTFTMGCKDGRDTDCSNDEKPAHSVTVKDFGIGKYEVTQAQWRAVMGSNPPELGFKGCDQCPVESVSWNDIHEFIKKLNTKTSKNYRLPTEAEWEYAARGGAKSRSYQYAGSNTIGEVAWYSENAGNKTYPVGQKKANELGIHDMSGNVWEWCNDWYSSDYYALSANGNNPKSAATGSYRVVRGGSWFDYPQDCRAASRNYNTPAFRYDAIGFRLAR